jgi:tRNA uridine 5-carboxymethylaminomethyl modification enzyme
LLRSSTVVPCPETERALIAYGSAPLKQPTNLAQLLRRPELSLPAVWSLAGLSLPLPAPDVAAQVEISIKYDGYVKRQREALQRAVRMEQARIPETFDYEGISGLSREVQEKLSSIRPMSLGQAARIAGVTPAALSLLSIHLRRAGAS